jgi:hypothetical protein
MSLFPHDYPRRDGFRTAGLLRISFLTVPPGDYRIQSLVFEAAWAAKYAGLNEHEMVRLVSSNVETILGLKKSRDLVVWEGSPAEFGGTVALSMTENLEGRLEVSACWPDEDDRLAAL